MNNTSIHTINSRNNIVLDTIKDLFQLDDLQLNKEINSSFEELIRILIEKKIYYTELRKALTPQTDRNEIAFVFDTTKIESSMYGHEVFKKIIPLFDKKSSHSILSGDFIGKHEIKQELHDIFFKEIKIVKQIQYKHHSQFYLVYINNLSTQMFKNFKKGLESFDSFVGYFNLNTSSNIKNYLSTIISSTFLKNKKSIITTHEEDVDNKLNFNNLGFPFEENGYNCKSLQSIYYYLFLAYKIERKVIPKLENDTIFSLNSITTSVFDIAEFNIILEEKKLTEYLLVEKLQNLERAGLQEMTTSELEKLIKEKIQDNYIYDLSFLHEHNTIKFNIMLEIEHYKSFELIKIRVGLKYSPIEKTLTVLTMI